MAKTRYVPSALYGSKVGGAEIAAEIIELPLASVTCKQEEEEITQIIIDKSSEMAFCLFNKQWLSRYPRAKHIEHDNGSEFNENVDANCEILFA